MKLCYEKKSSIRNNDHPMCILEIKDNFVREYHNIRLGTHFDNFNKSFGH